MFYEKQPKEEQEAYKKILKQIGLMSNLFSDSLKPADNVCRSSTCKRSGLVFHLKDLQDRCHDRICDRVAMDPEEPEQLGEHLDKNDPDQTAAGR